MGGVVEEIESGIGRKGKYLYKWYRSSADEKVFFMPGFFLPPDNFDALPYVDGMFNWNSAW